MIRQCLGFGSTEGKCQEVAGCAHSPYWCESCNRVRMDHITKSIEEILARMEQRTEVGRGASPTPKDQP